MNKAEELFADFIRNLKLECQIFDLDFEEEFAKIYLKYIKYV